jgi:hypothetical protein
VTAEVPLLQKHWARYTTSHRSAPPAEFPTPVPRSGRLAVVLHCTARATDAFAVPIHPRIPKTRRHLPITTIISSKLPHLFDESRRHLAPSLGRSASFIRCVRLAFEDLRSILRCNLESVSHRLFTRLTQRRVSTQLPLFEASDLAAPITTIRL